MRTGGVVERDTRRKAFAHEPFVDRPAPLFAVVVRTRAPGKQTQIASMFAVFPPGTTTTSCASVSSRMFSGGHGLKDSGVSSARPRSRSYKATVPLGSSFEAVGT